MGFHIPPFYSIGHLHMHCVIPPFNSNLKKLILFKWIFMPIDSMIEKLSSK